MAKRKPPPPPVRKSDGAWEERVLDDIDRQILEHYLEIDDHGRFLSPPSTDDQLHEFIEIAFGFNIPRKVIEPGHSSPFQFVADCFFERVDFALAFANRTGGKALSIDTPIFTPQGWRSLGELKVGDYVFGRDGKPTQIITTSPVYTDHECFEVEFNSGETIVADGEHRWWVNRAKQEPRIWTTREMFSILQDPPRIGYSTMFWIAKALPIHLPEQKLLVPPYVVGAWLGDGSRHDNSFYSADEEIVERLRTLWSTRFCRKTNETGECRTYYLDNLRATLRKMGDWPKSGHEKHIPAPYLYASISQRLELLRGLMDTDGCVSTARTNRCEISTVDKPLADGILWLVRSLGEFPTLYERGPGLCNGRKCKDVYRIQWTSTGVFNPFHLSRKRERLTITSRRISHKIRNIQPIKSVPVCCIEVDHPDHLYLAGTSLVPTHNTQNVAILNVLDMLFKGGCEIASAGATKDQAKKAFSYAQECMEQGWFKTFCTRWEKKVGRPFVQKEIQEETVFGNGSTQQILTASSKGLRSPHPHKARLDEVDEIEWSVIQTGLSMIRSSRGIKAQNIFTSTRQHLDGSMQRLLDEAKQRGITVYEWNIWESLERCTRRCFQDPKYGDCPVFAFCQGKAHACDGFYAIEDFINKVRQIDKDTFETEWTNSKPSREKLVYPSFNENVHIIGPKELFKKFGVAYPSQYWPRICGTDFGGGPDHPFVYLKLCQLPSGAWLIFFEYFAYQKTMREHAQQIKASPFYHSGERNYSDHARQDRIELQKEHKIKTWAAEKDVRMGINEIDTLLKGFPVAGQMETRPMLYVWFECVNLIQEFRLYSWPIRKDGKPDRSGVPDKKNDHGMDASRYAIYSHKRKPKRVYRTRRSAYI